MFFLISVFIRAQSSEHYTSYLTGSSTDADVDPDFGICMMGGGIEHNEAMKWFLQKANGGDVVVLRASGSDGYNNYMYNQLGVTLNSVETIVFHSVEASIDPYVLSRLAGAEAIWIAGGDQKDYIDLWKDTPVQEAINNLMLVRGGAVGGTSAGMAILGQGYFTGKNGSATSPISMNNPYHYTVNLGWDDFIETPFLNNTITDTHLNERTRYGRLMTFMARLINDYELDEIRGIGANLHVAVVIDQDGKARAFGDYPQYSDEFMYFLQSNCEVNQAPEIIQSGAPLTWNRSHKAVKVYKVPATPTGNNFLDLTDWKTGSGGEWQNWFIESGSLTMTENQDAPNCIVGIESTDLAGFKIYPNPASDRIIIESNGELTTWQVVDISGRVLNTGNLSGLTATDVDISALLPGTYIVVLRSAHHSFSSPLLKLR